VSSTDSVAFCKKLVVDANLGLAPGVAFGPEGEGFVRWCFASSVERLGEGVERLKKALNQIGSDIKSGRTELCLCNAGEAARNMARFLGLEQRFYPRKRYSKTGTYRPFPAIGSRA
jgi:hypothetical protein